MTWIVLVIVFSPGPEGSAYIPFQSAKLCGNSIPMISKALSLEHPKASFHCIDSGIPRVKPRLKEKQS